MSVVDASVAVALFKRDEAGHDTARAWWRRQAESTEPVASPAILPAEVGAALARGGVGSAVIRRAVDLFRAEDLVELHPVDASLGLLAAELAAVHQVRGCDAVYLALAQLLGTDLVTFYREQLERGGRAVATGEPGRRARRR